MGFDSYVYDNASSKMKSKEKKALIVVLSLTIGFMVIEAVAGVFTGSLALLSDAGHMLVDVVSVSMALVALWFSLKPPTSKKTYGFYRAEILAAFLNSLLLFGISLGIIVEAYDRLRIPTEVKSLEMSVVAFLGLLANLFSTYILSKIETRSLNLRGAILHVISDALGSLGALIAGLIMLKARWYYADPIISIVISVLILRGAWKLFSESVHVLLEGTPKGIDLESLEQAIRSHKGVLSVHDLHAWTLTQGFEALSAHLVIEDLNLSEGLIEQIKRHLYDKFRIHHVTLQVETTKCNDLSNGCYETGTPSL
jgi:cobalt-zinc-cadmium efflux system protein